MVLCELELQARIKVAEGRKEERKDFTISGPQATTSFNCNSNLFYHCQTIPKKQICRIRQKLQV